MHVIYVFLIVKYHDNNFIRDEKVIKILKFKF